MSCLNITILRRSIIYNLRISLWRFYVSVHILPLDITTSSHVFMLLSTTLLQLFSKIDFGYFTVIYEYIRSRHMHMHLDMTTSWMSTVPPGRHGGHTPSMHMRGRKAATSRALAAALAPCPLSTWETRSGVGGGGEGGGDVGWAIYTHTLVGCPMYYEWKSALTPLPTAHSRHPVREKAHGIYFSTRSSTLTIFSYHREHSLRTRRGRHTETRFPSILSTDTHSHTLTHRERDTDTDTRTHTQHTPTHTYTHNVHTHTRTQTTRTRPHTHNTRTHNTKKRITWVCRRGGRVSEVATGRGCAAPRWFGPAASSARTAGMSSSSAYSASAPASPTKPSQKQHLALRGRLG